MQSSRVRAEDRTGDGRFRNRASSPHLPEHYAGRPSSGTGEESLGLRDSGLLSGCFPNTYDLGIAIDQVVMRPCAPPPLAPDCPGERAVAATNPIGKSESPTGSPLLLTERKLWNDSSTRRSPKPNLVLLDLNLPKLSGLEVLRRLREDPMMESVPIAVLSSSTADADVRRTTALGIRVYLTKPDSLLRLEGLRNSLGAFISDVISEPRVAYACG